MSIHDARKQQQRISEDADLRIDELRESSGPSALDAVGRALGHKLDRHKTTSRQLHITLTISRLWEPSTIKTFSRRHHTGKTLVAEL
jgi:uncharacterized membrane protein YsdA (DUF1294 family)